MRFKVESARYMNTRVKMKVAILVSTYNGEEYLHAQISSLLDQKTDIEFDIYIRDDGSKDGTENMIEELALTNPNIFVSKSSGSNVGAKNSFLNLLHEVEADFYFFCDQDDVWEENKIHRSLSMLNRSIGKNEPQTPELLFTDLLLVDKSGHSLGETYWFRRGLKESFFSHWHNFVVFSMVTGCTMCFNNALRKIALSKSCPNGFFHDQWLAVLAKKYGTIVPLNYASVFYRQHGGNVVGTDRNSFKNIAWKTYRAVNANRGDYLELCREYDISILTFVTKKIKLVLLSLFKEKR